ncbi:similar to Saccharomyces cerevisiae YFL036W RPO41 Mitochondrial RNA polymerase [Maudiozyma saulgeensis]|uniref:DNA-directed RNA polymerase n=1 Tax=Maudiozyma saulgeensis TaxID=1789683 RepID=A0A1X7QYQ6_9SACH|nr:similar to Saccharomyces cerevisiae YFL036W RPO41 Mitochondrial RNA polymerase [Kazachstania saulgeensis]
MLRTIVKPSCHSATITNRLIHSQYIQIRNITTKNSVLRDNMSIISDTRTSTIQPPDTVFQQSFLRSNFLNKNKNRPQDNISAEFKLFTGTQNSVSLTMADKRDVMSLWSLLEACLQSNYTERSFSILKSLYEIKSHRKTFIDDYNYYFNHIAKDFKNVKLMSDKLQKDLTVHFVDIQPNDKTVAILIHQTLKLARKNNDIMNNSTRQNLELFFSMSSSGFKKICSNIDILTLDDYKTLHLDLDMIRDYQIPTNIRDLVARKNITMKNVSSEDVKKIEKEHNDKNDHNDIVVNSTNLVTDSVTSKASEPPMKLDEDVKTVEKDATKLMNVDTLGMRVIKHTLFGLSLNEEQKEKIAKFNFEAPDNVLDVNDKRTVNFYEMYKNLKTDEEKEMFETTLEEFNQNRQQTLEVRATDAAKERWRHDFEEAKARGDLSIQKSLNSKLWKWYTEMLPLLKKEIEDCKRYLNKETLQKSATNRTDYAPYLTLVDPEKMCVIVILELLKLNSTGGISEGMRTARAVISAGKSIEMEFRSEQLLKNESYLLKDINKKSNEFKQYVRNAKKSLRSLKLDESKIIWPQQIRAKVGSVLISMLIKVARVPVEGRDPISGERVFGDAPAFSHSYQYHNGVKLGVIRIHPALIHQLNGERLMASVQPQLLPMLVKPRPWVNWKSGGYYYSQSSLIRTKDSPEQMAYIEAASKSNAIDKVYDGLNVLGETSWTVNQRIFDVVSKVWNNGKPFLEIPGVQITPNYLPQPAPDADPSVVNSWKQKNREIANEFAANRSMRCDMNYKLEIARAFLGEKFYFPHNMDFRGRAYPLSPHFNHLGNDMSRSLLIFWKGKMLGKDGLRWLKVHLANLYGVNKIPIEGRVQFVEDHMDEIRDAVENPLNGKFKWWQTADKPWQTLATCIELVEALKLENPEEFISHQPVHQDGTCNGLQHYAALGGDMVGASQVNLIPDSKPNDVYMHVANIVRANLQKKVEANPDDEIAKFFIEKLNRKIVKQTVMTHVYGVTLIGATLQIDKQIHDMLGDRTLSLQYSKYLAKAVFAAIRQSFQGAHLIQDWLGECCNRISKSIRLDLDKKSIGKGKKPEFMTSIIWTTPLNLPIVQPYREISKKQVNTNLQTVYISDPFAVNKINARRQKAGFPPNFIHSLDASHMLMSATKCREDGLEFASVHDSYWTHASDIVTMNKNLREQFVALHEVDLIERLKDEFDERYKNYVQISKIPKSSDMAAEIMARKDTMAIELGRAVTYVDELQFEQERLALLNSEFEDDVKKGQEMVTTISLAKGSEELFSEKERKGEQNMLTILTPLELPEIPAKGDFDVASVKESTYFFS